jgi:hypothetical protein
MSISEVRPKEIRGDAEYPGKLSRHDRAFTVTARWSTAGSKRGKADVVCGKLRG